MPYPTHRATAGFTLLETLIYLALFTLIMVGVFSSLVAIQQSSERSRTHALLIEDATFASDRIQALIEDAGNILIPVLNDSGDYIVLTNGTGHTTIRVASSTLIEEHDDQSFPITDNGTHVATLQFTRNSEIDDPPHVTFSIVFQSTDTQNTVAIKRTVYRTP